ncbi:MAG TPA: metalloregulator ArsR/SmtB family transcription factor [Candidatus Kapabacteria bacterium]|jgi:ArsR family transcriptional regulator|nr:metalloregulator ArsR/SmtB family transcription factor [Candidatus Kapabacteria bacterium]
MKSIPNPARPTVDRTAELISALSDPIRLRLLSLILHNPDICVCDLEAVTELPQTKISKHLAVLRRADLVAPERQGTWMHYAMKKPENAIQRGLLEVVRNAHKSVPELREDLVRLKKSGCCLSEL